MKNFYYFLHNFNMLAISILAGAFILLHYPIIKLRIPFGLITSAMSFWYLSNFVKWKNEEIIEKQIELIEFEDKERVKRELNKKKRKCQSKNTLIQN